MTFSPASLALPEPAVLCDRDDSTADDAIRLVCDTAADAAADLVCALPYARAVHVPDADVIAVLEAIGHLRALVARLKVAS